MEVWPQALKAQPGLSTVAIVAAVGTGRSVSVQISLVAFANMVTRLPESSGDRSADLCRGTKNLHRGVSQSKIRVSDDTLFRVFRGIDTFTLVVPEAAELILSPLAHLERRDCSTELQD